MTSPASVLDRELYSVPEAARLLGLAPSTLHYWLQGGERQRIAYAPIIRPEPLDRRWVTWAEFIEHNPPQHVDGGTGDGYGDRDGSGRDQVLSCELRLYERLRE